MAEIGLVLLVLFLFMFIQGGILAFILVRISDRHNNQATKADVDVLLSEINSLKEQLVKKPAVKSADKKAPVKTVKKPVVKKPAAKSVKTPKTKKK